MLVLTQTVTDCATRGLAVGFAGRGGPVVMMTRHGLSQQYGQSALSCPTARFSPPIVPNLPLVFFPHRALLWLPVVPLLTIGPKSCILKALNSK